MLTLYNESESKVSITAPEDNEDWKLVHSPDQVENYWQWRKDTGNPQEMYLKIVMIFENLTPQQVMSAAMMESRQQWDIGQ